MSADYWLSSQANRWQLSPSQISWNSKQSLTFSDPSKSINYSRDEHLAIGIFVSNSITTMCKRLGLRQRCAATACVYAKRFFSKVPYSQAPDPSLVACACVYVASKIEETPVHVRSVCQEAAKVWADLPHAPPAPSPSLLAEMEFYLLEELDFDLIVHHAYRSLTSIAENFGKGRGKGKPSFDPSSSNSDSNKDSSSMRKNFFGSEKNQVHHHSTQAQTQMQGQGQGQGQGQSLPAFGKGLSSLPPKPGTFPTNHSFNQNPAPNPSASLGHPNSAKSQPEEGALEEDGEIRAASSTDGMRDGHQSSAGEDQTIDWEMNELDEQALQMAWFIINDTYRTEIPLIYPPYIIAVSALFLALSLHPPARKKLEESCKGMREKRLDWKRKCAEAGFPISLMDSELELESDSESESDPSFPSGFPTETSLNQASSPKGTDVESRREMPMEKEEEKQKATTSRSSLETFRELKKQRPKPPKNDSLTFIASLNISLPLVSQVIQEILDNYSVWHRVSNPKPKTNNKSRDSQTDSTSFPSVIEAVAVTKPEIQIEDGAWGILYSGKKENDKPGSASGNGNESNSNFSSSSQTSSKGEKSTSKTNSKRKQNDVDESDRMRREEEEAEEEEIGIFKRLENLRERRRLRMIHERESSSSSDPAAAAAAAFGKSLSQQEGSSNTAKGISKSNDKDGNSGEQEVKNHAKKRKLEEDPSLKSKNSKSKKKL